MMLFLFKFLTFYLSLIFLSVLLKYILGLLRSWHPPDPPLNFVSEAGTSRLTPVLALLPSLLCKDYNSLSFVVKSSYQSQVIWRLKHEIPMICC